MRKTRAPYIIEPGFKYCPLRGQLRRSPPTSKDSEFQDNNEAVCLSPRQCEREPLLKLTYAIPIRQRRYAQVSCSSYGSGLTSTYRITSNRLRLAQGTELGERRHDCGIGTIWPTTTQKIKHRWKSRWRKQMMAGKNFRENPPHSAFGFYAPKGTEMFIFSLHNLTVTAGFCRVGSAQGVSGDGRALRWLKAEELFTGSHKRLRDDQIFCS